MTRRYTEKQREADAVRAQAYYWEHSEERKEYARTQRVDNPEKYLAIRRKSQQKLVEEVYAAYGEKCACCGETMKMFLTLDHISGGGSEHRKSLGGSLAIFRDLRKRGYPAGYQILCYNCNCGKARNGGICPHENARTM